jgi:formamidopyrimidine-DNA glycosylase
MPELPEVETVKRDLTQSVLDRRIEGIRVLDGRVIRDISSQQFVKRLTGRTIKDISRRGKAIICRLDNGQHFIVQLMMTGQLVSSQNLPEPLAKETKIIFQLSNQTHLLYNDQRLFGRLTVIEDLAGFKHFTTLGPEPFDASFNPRFIKETFHNRAVAVKKVLLDHTFVAGIGNIYASEILFRSGIDPRRQAKRIKPVEIKRMHRLTIEVLEEAILHRGSSMRNYRDGRGEKGQFNALIRVYAREGEPCLNCAKPINKIVQGGRSTFFCKNCQR